MSSYVSCGYSTSSSASVSPSARKSRISDTHMRVPLIYGLPPQIRGSREIRSSILFIMSSPECTMPESSLLQLDQAPPDLPPALHLVLDIRRVPPAHRARHRLGVLYKPGQHLQQRLAVVEEDVPPHH